MFLNLGRDNIILSGEISTDCESPSLENIFESLMFGFIEDAECYHDVNTLIGEGFILNEEIDPLHIGENIGYFNEDKFNTFKNNGYDFTSIILTESNKYYTSEFNNNMTVGQLSKIVKLLASFGKKSVDLLFKYYTYRINNSISSAYDKIKNNKATPDHFRLSDHWNIKTKNMGITEDGVTVKDCIRIAEWDNEKRLWIILKEIGKKESCSINDIKKIILSKNIFKNNKECLHYLNN